MIQGNPTWNAALGALQKQPVYQLNIPAFSITLTSQAGASGTLGPVVRNYWPGNLSLQLQQTLQWLLGQQGETGGNWNANALETGLPSGGPGTPYIPTTPPLVECGIVSIAPMNTGSLYAQTVFENIVAIPPVGLQADQQGGPDGYPIDYGPPLGYFVPVFNISSGQIATAYANLMAQYPSGHTTICGTTYAVPDAITVYGAVYNLLQPITSYRVDCFVRTDKWYYMSSAPGTANYSSGPCNGLTPVPSPFQNLLILSGGSTGSFAVNVTNPGLCICVLYHTSVSQPGVGSSFTTLPAGWIAHTNTGLGKKLNNFFARIFEKTDIEYLQEDNVPIVVQDDYHARCGSSVVPTSGTLTVQIIYRDPINGNVEVFDSLAAISAFAALPRSFTVPPSDPLYVLDPALTNVSALQNRSFIYDCALAIIAFSASANFTAAAKIVAELDTILATPGYIPSTVLENAEDGLTSRWTHVNGTVSNVAANSMSPQEPPYGAGQVIEFQSTAASATFTYSGSGFPDTTDGYLSSEHYEPLLVAFTYTIGVTTTLGHVTSVQVTSGTPGPATYNSGTHTITIPIGTGLGMWRSTLVNLAGEIAALATDTLVSITSFQAALPATTTLLYLDNLSVGGLQPTNSLTFSYDVFYGQIDQAYIRAGSMAWVVYAIALYMQLSGDYTPALSLQAMINFLLTLQSSAADLTDHLFYLGYGAYKNPGYQYVPGIQHTVSTEHQVDIYFGFLQAATALTNASSVLLKAGVINSTQAASLAATAASITGIAGTVAATVIANLYIAPAGGVPGHFAQGVTGSTLDPSYALDASGYLTALMCHQVNRDDLALQCVEFMYQTFYVTNQTIQLSSGTNTWNEAYQELLPFVGMKTYADGAGGYSGSPTSVWGEGTWGFILALLRLYSISGIQAYFQGLGTTIDTVLLNLIGAVGQYLELSTTGNGSLIQHSAASRDLPWEFEVWPALADSAWLWCVSTNPNLLAGTGLPSTLLDDMQIPQGPSATPNELTGACTIGQMTVNCIDPSGTIKALAAQDALIGQIAEFQMGFYGLPQSNFVTLHTLQITQVGWTPEGLITFTLSDVQRFIQGQQIWTAGGPETWAPGQVAVQPVGPAAGPNAFPASNNNPRFLQGNPIDLALAALQNELGVGQSSALFNSNFITQQLAPIYAQQQNYTPAGYPAGWVVFHPGTDSTLINPNPYINIPQWLNVRNTLFSGVWFEFQITRPIDGKQFVEEQILKPLGLYMTPSSNGQLILKPMKPTAYATSVFPFNAANVIGIPQTERQTIVNLLTAKTDVGISGPTLAARQYNQQLTYEQNTSLQLYRQVFSQNVESNGLRVNYAAVRLSRWLADVTFRRHSFAPPAYRVRAHLASLPVEVADLVSLTHPKLVDFATGKLGVSNVTCEAIDRRPNYAQGYMEFLLLDLRFTNAFSAYQVAATASMIPPWTSATQAERQQYMFIALGAMNGQNPDGTPGNTIY